MMNRDFNNNLTINSELEAARTLTHLANHTSNTTNSRPFWLSAKINSTLSLSLPTLCSDSEDDVVVIEQDSVEESSLMARKPIQTRENTGVQLNPSGSQTRALHARTKIQDLNLNVAPEESATEVDEDSEGEYQTMMTNPRQAEKSTEIPKNPSGGKSSAPHGGCKTRRDSNRLTEDQKEGRKLHRMLANRMSARKTILRRQARCEDLARQAAELECENQNLKERKEAAMKVYESLKTTNEILKAQLTGVTMTDEVKETRAGSKSAKTHAPASTTSNTRQFYLFHQTSSVPCVLPYMTASATIVQPPPQNNIAVESQSTNKNPSRVNLQGNPSAALPYPWLCFPAHHANGAPPLSLDLAGKHSQSGTSSVRKTISHEIIRKDQRSPPKKMRGEASTSAGITRAAAQADKAAGKRIIVEPTKVTSVAAAVGSSRGSQVAAVGLSARQNVARRGRNDVASSTSATSSSSEDQEELNRREIRRQIIAYTTAVARRWRKAVVKTKNFQYSRHRIKISSR